MERSPLPPSSDRRGRIAREAIEPAWSRRYAALAPARRRSYATSGTDHAALEAVRERVLERVANALSWSGEKLRAEREDLG